MAARSSDHICLVSGCCSSGRDFAPRFLQTVPRGSALALHSCFTSIRLHRGLAPPGCWTCPAHRTLRAAAGGALRASLTFAARDELGERRSGRRDGRIDRTTGRLAGSAGGEVGCEWPAVLGDAVDGVQQLAHGGNEGELGRLA